MACASSNKTHTPHAAISTNSSSCYPGRADWPFPHSPERVRNESLLRIPIGVVWDLSDISDVWTPDHDMLARGAIVSGKLSAASAALTRHYTSPVFIKLPVWWPWWHGGACVSCVICRRRVRMRVHS